MLKIRRSKDRGYFDHGWLRTHHSFSFGEYYDPSFMEWGSLRVINEDFIRGGAGFETHGHRDMEIVTYMLEGALEHRDSTGGHGVIRQGEIQTMSAGRGIRHSEANALKDQETHLLQIWIKPRAAGLAPGYNQKSFENSLQTHQPVLLVSPDGAQGSLSIQQDARIWAWRLSESKGQKEELKIEVNPKTHGYLYVVRGKIAVGGDVLESGDALYWSNSQRPLVLKNEGGPGARSEIMWFEV